MYLGIVNLIRALLRPTSDTNDEKHLNGKIDHSYIRGNIANRGPCPALNALANQGYLPRDGKSLTIPQVENALITNLHQTTALAKSIARPLNDILRSDGTFDLVDMRRHNIIEHDASMTRLDARQGDNYTLQPAMLQAMLDDAKGGPVTVKSLARSYNRRKRERKADGGVPVPWSLWFVNVVQTVSFLNTAGTGGELEERVVREFYEEERIPEAVLRDDRKRTLVGLLSYAVQLLFYVVFDA